MGVIDFRPQNTGRAPIRAGTFIRINTVYYKPKGMRLVYHGVGHRACSDLNVFEYMCNGVLLSIPNGMPWRWKKSTCRLFHYVTCCRAVWFPFQYTDLISRV